MTDEQTSVLDSRPNRTADDTGAQPTDVPALNWRVPVALLAAASAIAAGVVWLAGDDAPAAAERAAADGTRPTVSAPVTSAPAATTAADAAAPVEATTPAAAPAPETVSPSTPTAEAAPEPAGWEPRTFEGVTFAVPPGARMADLVDVGGADSASLFSWNGPLIGGDMYSYISVWIDVPEGAPTLGPEYLPITVPGATTAHMWTGPVGVEPETLAVDVHVLTADRRINVVAAFAPGAAGEQQVRDLVASLVVG